MNPYNGIAAVIDRIGFAGGASRARDHDAYRVEVNGGPPPNVQVRLEAVTERLELIADDLKAQTGMTQFPWAWQGYQRRGGARLGLVRQGVPWKGVARPGRAWLGKARLGRVRRGKA